MILVITGPTGIGKTKLSISLAKKYNAIIINGDSMQVYKELNIGTAKIKEEEKEGIPHYLFDIKSINENYTVYDYQKDVRKLLNDHKDDNIIIVGGTGLYIKAALYNYEFKEENTSNTYDNLTNEELYQKVLEKDPNSNIHLSNRVRLIRFLNRENTPNNGNDLLYRDSIFIGLTTARDTLYNILDNRVDKMFKDGLLEEVKDLYQKFPRNKAINTAIGYKELYDYLDGKLSLEESINLIKQRTRHYAKRQYTWFNNQMDITWFNSDLNNFDNTVNEIINYIERVK